MVAPGGGRLTWLPYVSTAAVFPPPPKSRDIVSVVCCELMVVVFLFIGRDKCTERIDCLQGMSQESLAKRGVIIDIHQCSLLIALL